MSLACYVNSTVILVSRTELSATPHMVQSTSRFQHVGCQNDEDVSYDHANVRRIKMELSTIPHT